MTLVTNAVDGMRYETTKPKKVDGKAASIKVAERLGTPTLLWMLMKRHKVGLLLIGNLVLVANWVVPQWPQMVLSIVH